MLDSESSSVGAMSFLSVHRRCSPATTVPRIHRGRRPIESRRCCGRCRSTLTAATMTALALSTRRERPGDGLLSAAPRCSGPVEDHRSRGTPILIEGQWMRYSTSGFDYVSQTQLVFPGGSCAWVAETPSVGAKYLVRLSGVGLSSKLWITTIEGTPVETRDVAQPCTLDALKRLSSLLRITYPLRMAKAASIWRARLTSSL